MTEASESGKITMVQWNKEWQNLTRSLDIRRTIRAIESAGNKAEYHSADVTDVNSIKLAIDNRRKILRSISEIPNSSINLFLRIMLIFVKI